MTREEVDREEEKHAHPGAHRRKGPGGQLVSGYDNPS